MAAKRKRMTEQDKRLRAWAKKELQAKGTLPPNKPKLNRAKYCEEAGQILKADNSYSFSLFLQWALMEMLQSKDKPFSKGRSLIAVGAAKVIYLAKRRMEFEASLGSGASYTLNDLYEATKDIFDA